MPLSSSFAITFWEQLSSWRWILPELFLACTLISILMLSVLRHLYQRTWSRPIALVGILLAMYTKYHLTVHLTPSTIPLTLFGSLLVLDSWSILFFFLLLSIGALALVAAPSWLAEEPGAMALALGILLGSSLLIMAHGWLPVYLGMALITISMASLMAISLTPWGSVGGLYYLFYSMTIGAVMLWGMSYWYGLMGTLSWTAAMWHNWHTFSQHFMLLIVLLCTSTLLFSAGIAPFHLWIPSVYCRIPAHLVAYFSTVPKLAAMVILIRLMHQADIHLASEWTNRLRYGMGCLSLTTMIVGHLGALLATDWRRVLAHGSIAQGGLLLAGVAALPHCEVGVLYYSVVYGMMGWAVWQGLDLLEERHSQWHFAGLGWRYPILGVSITVVFVALVGLPPTVGFTGKWLIWAGLWQQYQHTADVLFAVLLITSMLGTVLSLYYYFRLMRVLWASPTENVMTYEALQYTELLVMLVAACLLIGFLMQSII